VRVPKFEAPGKTVRPSGKRKIQTWPLVSFRGGRKQGDERTGGRRPVTSFTDGREPRVNKVGAEYCGTGAALA